MNQDDQFEVVRDGMAKREMDRYAGMMLKRETERRSGVIVADGSWYDEAGKFLGQGCILREDIGKLIEVAVGGKCFVVCPTPVGKEQVAIDHLIKWAIYVVANGAPHYIHPIEEDVDDLSTTVREGLPFKVIGQREFREILGV